MQRAGDPKENANSFYAKRGIKRYTVKYKIKIFYYVGNPG